MFNKKTLIGAGFLAILIAGFSLSEYLARSQMDAAGFEIGAPFDLQDQHHQPADEQIFTARPTALFFGFTHCPDICPTTLTDLIQWREEAGLSAEDVQIIFITIDPERDTAEHLKNYLAFFAPDITGLTGDKEQVLTLVRQWGIYREEIRTGDAGLTYDHTATVFLLNKAGRLTGTIALEEKAENAIAKLQNLAAASG